MIKIDLKELSINSKTSQQIIDKTFEANQIEKELGSLGRFFGFGENVKLNIAGLFILLLLFTGIGYTFVIIWCDTTNNLKAIGIIDFWSIITPLITLALGFIFGKNQN